MKKGRLADFFFVGLGIVPVALMFGGLPHLAILLFIPLMFVACYFGMAEQIEEQDPPTDGDAGAGHGTPSPDTPELTFRERDPRE